MSDFRHKMLTQDTVPWNMSAHALLNQVNYAQAVILDGRDIYEVRKEVFNLVHYQTIITRMKALRGKDKDVEECFPGDYQLITPVIREHYKAFHKLLKTRMGTTVHGSKKYWDECQAELKGIMNEYADKPDRDDFVNGDHFSLN